jgi:hypothetical protein
MSSPHNHVPFSIDRTRRHGCLQTSRLWSWEHPTPAYIPKQHDNSFTSPCPRHTDSLPNPPSFNLRIRLWTPRSAPSPSLSRRPTPSPLRLWRRPNKRKVHLNRLLKQLRAVRAVNGCAGLVQRWVLDKCVALDARRSD